MTPFSRRALSIAALAGLGLPLAFGRVPPKERTPSPRDLVKMLVDVPTGTRRIDMIDRVQHLVSSHFEDMGFAIKTIPNPAGKKVSGNLVVASRQGKSEKFVTLLVHVDTVFDLGEDTKAWSESADKKTAKGPGVIDDKGGVVIAWEGVLRFLMKRPDSKLSLRIISSPNEEAGSEGFLDTFRDYAKQSLVTLGFEPALEDGSIISSRRGNRWYEIEVKGREAHSGRAHREGINACLDLSEKLAAISRLTDYEKDVTVSIGRIEGGQDKFNVVCGSARAKVDTRFPDLASGTELHRKIEEILKKPAVKAASDGKETETSFRIADDCPPMATDAKSAPYLELYRSLLAKREKRATGAGKSGGASDANYFAVAGTPVIDGLGPRGGGMHTRDEYIELASLEERIDALVDFLEGVEDGKLDHPGK